MPDEAAWAAATPMTNFTQIDPFEGEPVSQPTDVRFLFDDDALYIGGRFLRLRPHHDSPGASGRRRFGLGPLHGFHRTATTTIQTSYRFTTNPSGIKRGRDGSERRPWGRRRPW